MFMHAGIMHIGFNMLVLWMLGAKVEYYLGPQKFLFLYFTAGFGGEALHLGTMAAQFYLQYGTVDVPYPYGTVGASGAVYGILLAAGKLFPRDEVGLFFLPFRFRLIYLVIFLAAYSLYRGLINAQGDNIAHFAHLGGMVFSYLLLKFWRH